jgi:dTDP-4-amino-4,6-dideoxygalactose transaminase
MPSWSHVATAAAAVSAGLRPYFLDCDAKTWALDVSATERHARSADVRAVVVVAPFGGRIDYAAWDDFSRTTSIPVVIDGAAAFDQFVNFGHLIPWGRTPVMVSLHATKVLGIGEGGLLLSADPELMLRTRECSNFGIKDDRNIEGAIGNFKMSEYAAAMGLAALAGWPERRAQLHALGASMAAQLSARGLRTAPGFGGEFVSSTCMISAPGRCTEEMEIMLRAAGLGTRRWWREGLHGIPEFSANGRDDLPVTSELARSFIGAPFYPDMPSQTAERIAVALEL